MIFLAQLIFPQWIKRTIFTIIIITQATFIFEYIWNIIYLIADLDKNLINLVSIFVNFDDGESIDKSIQTYLLLIMYCFHMQYVSYKSELFNNDDQQYNLNSYIKRNLENFPNVRTFFDNAVSALHGLWLWIILLLLFISITSFSYYALFSIKLVLLFVIIYFITHRQDDKDGLVKCIWILIIYCSVNTILVYTYQFTRLRLIKEWYSVSILNSLPNLISYNLSVLGLEVYEDRLAFSFLPHYASNLLSVLLLCEIKRLNDRRNMNSIHSLLKKQRRISKSYKSDISYPKYYLYKISLGLCKLYWIFIFISICATMVSVQFSLAFITYIATFTISYLIMFKQMVNIINRLNAKNPKFYLSRLISYSLIEEDKHIEIKKTYRNRTFKYILICSMGYIMAIYLYSLFDSIQNYDGKYPIVEKETEAVIRGLCYIIGIYNEILKQTSFIKNIRGHMYFMIFVILDIYIQRLEGYLIQQITQIDDLIKFKNDLKVQIKSRKISLMSRRSNCSIEDNSEEPMQHVNTDYDREIISGQRNSDIIISFESTSMIYKVLNIFIRSTQKDKIFNLNSSIRISHKIFIKKVVEKVIILMLLLTAIIKLNILSIVYMIYALILEIKLRSVYKIYLTSIFLICMMLLQSLVFLSNINTATDPFNNYVNLYFINKYLGLPWYDNIISDGWAFYFNLGISQYQLKTLWCEFWLIMICFIYLSIFTYSIFDYENRKISFYKIGSYKSVQKAMATLTEDEYNNMRQNFKISFNIDLSDFNGLLSKMNLTTNFEGKYERKQSVVIEDGAILIKKGKLSNFIHKLKKVVYLTFHNYILVLTLILSMMNSGIISTIYIIFSLQFLYKSTDMILGKRFEILKASSGFFRVFLIIDLSLQMIYQLPINNDINNSIISNDVLGSIGINKIHDFRDLENKSTFDINAGFLFQDIFKVSMYFLVSIMVLIYESNSFKEFYIKYIIIQRNRMAKNSAINTFLFNNKRIELMEKIVNYRQEIHMTLHKVEKHLEKWESKLGSNVGTTERVEKDTTVVLEELTDKDIRDKIREKIKNGFLIHLAIILSRRTSSYSFTEKEEKEEYENAVVRGSINIKCKIEKKIDEFVDQLDLSDIKPDQIDSLFDMTKIEKINKQDKGKDDIFNEDIEIFEEEIDTAAVQREEAVSLPVKRVMFDVRETVYEDRETVTESIKIKFGRHTFNVSESDGEHKFDTKKSHIDPVKYDNIIRNKLFKKYLNKWYIVYIILFYCFKYIYINFDLVVFFFMILNNMINGSMISLIYPIIVFTFGLIAYPRNHNIFWKFILIYSSAIIVLKFIIQLKFTKVLFNITHVIKDEYRLGFKIFESSYSIEFLSYIVWDCLVLLFAMLQTYILIVRGIWEKIEPELETVEMAYDRIFKAKAIMDNEIDELKESLVLRVAQTNSKFSIFHVWENIKHFYESLFPRIRVSLLFLILEYETRE
jgi:hypothetical protein